MSTRAKDRFGAANAESDPAWTFCAWDASIGQDQGTGGRCLRFGPQILGGGDDDDCPHFLGQPDFRADGDELHPGAGPPEGL
jgi:hypothetical protein